MKEDKKAAYGVLPHHPEKLTASNCLPPPPQPRKSVDEHALCAELEGRPSNADWLDKLPARLSTTGAAW